MSEVLGFCVLWREKQQWKGSVCSLERTSSVEVLCVLEGEPAVLGFCVFLRENQRCWGSVCS